MARTLKLYMPLVVAEPVMEPEEFIKRPGGRLPLETLQLTVPMPFAAVNCCEYDRLLAAGAMEVDWMLIGGTSPETDS